MNFVIKIVGFALVLLATPLAKAFPAETSHLIVQTLVPTNTDSEYDGTLGNMDERGPYEGGDMIFPDDLLETYQAGIKDTRYRWPNKIFPFNINGTFSANDRATIQKAMTMISNKTCIRFKQRTNEKDYVSIENADSGCYSYVGRIGGKQILNLGSGCVYKAIPAHEMIHALGFYHEQSRTDRDDFVTINWDNIEKKYQFAFDKYGSDYVNPFNVSYDYGSVMHYGSTAFAIDYSKPTITVKTSGAKIGQREGISDKDALKIKNMYGC